MPKRDEAVDVSCPKCGRRLKVGAEQAEKRMTVRCPCGELVPLVKAFG